MLPTPASADNNNNSVSFGRVNVHKHRMTLGNHPFASGIPVELSWDVESSDEMSMEAYESSSTSDANTDQHHDTSSNSQSSPHRLTSQIRREIAEEHHSRESIFAVLKEASLLRHAIVKSLEEDHNDQDPELDALLYMMDPESQSLHRSPASVSLPPPLAPPPPHQVEPPLEKIPWSKRLCERMQQKQGGQIQKKTPTTSTITTTSCCSPDADARRNSRCASQNNNHQDPKWSKKVCQRLRQMGA